MKIATVEYEILFRSADSQHNYIIYSFLLNIEDYCEYWKMSILIKCNEHYLKVSNTHTHSLSLHIILDP